MLVVTDLCRALLLTAIPLLALADLLTIGLLAAFMVAFGTLSLLNDAAHQSFLPRLVPRRLLTPANARLEQSAAVAQTSGPMLGGGLVSWLGAPVAVLVDAASYLVSGLLTAMVRVEDPRPAAADRPAFWRSIREGLSWVYRHRTLMPFAVSGRPSATPPPTTSHPQSTRESPSGVITGTSRISEGDDVALGGLAFKSPDATTE